MPPLLPQQPRDEGMTHLTPEDTGLWEISGPRSQSKKEAEPGFRLRCSDCKTTEERVERRDGCRQSSKPPTSLLQPRGPLRQTDFLWLKPGEGWQVITLQRHVRLPASPLPPPLTPFCPQKRRIFVPRTRPPRRTLSSLSSATAWASAGKLQFPSV